MIASILALMFSVTPQITYARETVETPRVIISTDEKTLVDLVKEEANKNDVDEKVVMRIISCESSWNPEAIGTHAKIGEDIGLFQINSYYHEDNFEKVGLNIREPRDNIKAGFELIKTSGFKPWSASRKCWSLDKEYGLLYNRKIA